jgi:hypothetical protein
MHSTRIFVGAQSAATSKSIVEVEVVP